VVASSCSTRKTSKNCNTLAKVIDMSEVDGCGLLFEINTNKFKPLEFKVPKPQLEAGMLVYLDYQPLKGVMSTCMAEQGSIAVSCIKVVKRPCISFKSIDELPWLVDLKQKMRPQKITYYQNEADEDLFVLDLGKFKYLYDCHGALDCSASTDDLKSDCYQKFASLKNGATIFSR
jgi:hypothetical protein